MFLKAVDHVFNHPHIEKPISPNPIKHESFRYKHTGLVELWPLFENDESHEHDFWAPPVNIKSITSGPEKLTHHIAKTIKHWLDSNEVIESRNRPIKPGDVMILVRSRSTLMDLLNSVLRSYGIPVGGRDRIKLNEELVIEDLFAMADFVFSPKDDLTLASILKSPFIGLSEEALYDLAIDRPGSLYEAIKDSNHKDVYAYLENLIKEGRSKGPLSFFNMILNTPCPANTISGRKAVMSRLGDTALDTINEVLNSAGEFERTSGLSLLHFVHEQRSIETDLKREMSQESEHVRILTVHGAKGLQAPVVIMPDTTRIQTSPKNDKSKRLLWPSDTGLDIPLWTPHSNMEFDLYKASKKRIEEKENQEYQRLLYVAMTRAEDRLYIGGYSKKRKPREDSWYFDIKRGLESCSSIQKDDDGTLILSNPQLEDPKKQGKTISDKQGYKALPKWIYKTLNEEYSFDSIRPSRKKDGETSSFSPFLEKEKTDQKNNHALLKGRLTHKLLEFLPQIKERKREETARKFLELDHIKLDQNIRQIIMEEIFSILDHPEYKKFFSTQALSEVPVSGLLEDISDKNFVKINARIDRLLIEDHDIWILDYKTGRIENPVPESYKNQLRLYKDLIKEIYPNHAIHTYLLWTETAEMVVVDLE